MSKRSAYSGNGAGALKRGGRPDAIDVDENLRATDMGEFEDKFEDEFESEDEIHEAGVDGRPDVDRETETAAIGNETLSASGTFIIGRSVLAAGESLDPDPTAYEMLHSLSTPWPCLSFDIVRDGLGDNRSTIYPATMYTVAGTQAGSGRDGDNALMVMKFSGLSKMENHNAEDDSDDDDDDDDEDGEPVLESRTISLHSTTNRVRAHHTLVEGRPPTTLTATMAESAQVLIHDISPHLAAFDVPGSIVSSQQNKSIHIIKAHRSEGYGIDWSPLHPAGRLLTGDNDGLIYITTRSDTGHFQTNERPFCGHESRIEELQWSPSEASVFASASSDGTVRVWDVRSKSRKSALTVRVSDTDVNVMSWSKQTTHLLASGAEDGEWAVWDLRQWKPQSSGPANETKSTPIASFKYHTEQITSVEWHPTDDSIVAVAAGDNTVTLWDLAVELDDDESKDPEGLKNVPPQLLFVHFQNMAKEVHWHPQIPGALIATGEHFSVFRTISM